jgi:hypothetical protein
MRPSFQSQHCPNILRHDPTMIEFRLSCLSLDGWNLWRPCTRPGRYCKMFLSDLNVRSGFYHLLRRCHLLWATVHWLSATIFCATHVIGSLEHDISPTPRMESSVKSIAKDVC